MRILLLWTGAAAALQLFEYAGARPLGVQTLQDGALQQQQQQQQQQQPSPGAEAVASAPLPDADLLLPAAAASRRAPAAAAAASPAAAAAAAAARLGLLLSLSAVLFLALSCARSLQSSFRPSWGLVNRSLAGNGDSCGGAAAAAAAAAGAREGDESAAAAAAAAGASAGAYRQRAAARTASVGIVGTAGAAAAAAAAAAAGVRRRSPLHRQLDLLSAQQQDLVGLNNIEKQMVLQARQELQFLGFEARGHEEDQQQLQQMVRAAQQGFSESQQMAERLSLGRSIVEASAAVLQQRQQLLQSVSHKLLRAQQRLERAKWDPSQDREALLLFARSFASDRYLSAAAAQALVAARKVLQHEVFAAGPLAPADEAKCMQMASWMVQQLRVAHVPTAAAAAAAAAVAEAQQKEARDLVQEALIIVELLRA
ncbi:hypothetical protein ETH_00002480, partial [Eimeria tenella]